MVRRRSTGCADDGDQDQEEKEAEDEDAQEDISSSSFLPQRITRSKLFKELGSSGNVFSFCSIFCIKCKMFKYIDFRTVLRGKPKDTSYVKHL